jgi:AmmeMemoRadiSam system protein B
MELDRASPMCATSAVAITLIAARALGATDVARVGYGSSKEVSGDDRRVVTYGGYVIR